MAKKIKGEDLLEKGLFDDAIEGAKVLERNISDLINGFKELHKESKESMAGNPLKDAKDIDDLNDAVLRSIKIRQEEAKAKAELAKATREEFKNSQLLEKAIAAEAKEREKAQKALEASNSAYAQASKRLNDLRKSYKDLAVAGKENTTEAQKFKAEITKLDAQLKKVDATVGQHQRNVGNYKSAFEALPGPMGNAAQAAGSFGDSLKTLAKNPFVIVAGLLIAALYGIGKAFTSTDSGAVKFDGIMRSISNIIDVVRVRAISVAEGISNIFSGDFSAAADNFKASVSGVGDELNRVTRAAMEYAEAIDAIEDAESNYISQAADNRNKIAKLEFDAADRTKTAKERKAALLEAKRISEEESKFYEKKADERLQATADELAVKAGIRKADVLNFIAMTDEQQKYASEAQLKARNEFPKEFAALEELYQKKVDANTKFFEDNKRNEGKITAFEEEEQRKRDDARKKAEEARKKADDEAARLQKEYSDVKIRNIENDRLREIETVNQNLKEKKEGIKGNTDIEIKLRAEYEEEAQRQIAAIKKKYRDAENAAATTQANNEKEARDKQIAALKVTMDREREANEKLAKEEEDRKKKQREDAIEQAEQLAKIAADGLNKAAELRKEKNEEEIELRKSNIDRQQELADKGLANTLAFEKKKLAEAELRKEEEKQRDIRRAKALLYMNATIEYAKQDPNSAPFKALAQVIIAETIAGAFKDGVENFQGKGTETSDSNLILFSKGESVATAKGTKENPGLVTAMNEGRVEEYFKQNYLMNTNFGAPTIAPVVDMSAPVQELKRLNNQIKNLERAILNKKETVTHWDTHGNMVVNEVSNGMRQTIKYVKAKPRI
jgi:hypothetical protein